MIEIIQEYWKAYLWHDGYHISGVAMSLWLLVVSLSAGFVISVPLVVNVAPVFPEPISAFLESTADSVTIVPALFMYDR